MSWVVPSLVLAVVAVLLWPTIVRAAVDLWVLRQIEEHSVRTRRAASEIRLIDFETLREINRIDRYAGHAPTSTALERRVER